MDELQKLTNEEGLQVAADSTSLLPPRSASVIDIFLVSQSEPMSLSSRKMQVRVSISEAKVSG